MFVYTAVDTLSRDITLQTLAMGRGIAAEGFMVRAMTDEKR